MGSVVHVVALYPVKIVFADDRFKELCICHAVNIECSPHVWVDDLAGAPIFIGCEKQ